MRHIKASAALSLFFCVSLFAQNSNERAGAGGLQSFLGRWEISAKPPNGDPRPIAIIDITGESNQPAVKMISSAARGDVSPAFRDVRIDGEVISLTMDAGAPVVLKGRRVGDRLELAVEGGSAQEFIGVRTTKDSVEQPAMKADQKAFDAAMDVPSAERTAALDKFIAEFPDSPLKERARLQVAGLVRDPKERQAAFEKFLADFPEGKLRDQATFQLAGTVRDPEQRVAALKKFMADFPKSSFAETAMMQVLDSIVRKKPVDEAAAARLIDDFLNSGLDAAPAATGFMANRRATTLNNIADRLMENDILLDRALGLINQAIAGMPEKAPASMQSMFLTTLGQVQFKRKELALAEESLKKAIAAGGDEGSGEAEHYLGKIAEARNENDAALDFYLKAAAKRTNPDLKSSLEKAYSRKHGGLEGLHETIDAALLAKPKSFEPGHYDRPAGAEPGRTVLAELFTGSECGPCVASDLAFDGLLERYDRATVAVLEYHLHIPGPDPMTNSDTERRAKYYGVNATPTAIIDGTDKQVGGGPASGASRTFDRYKGKVEKRVLSDPPVSISAISLQKNETAVTVSVEVKPKPDAASGMEKARLRVALVEELVHYTGSNGIHFHRFVVRKMLGPEEGTALRPADTTRFSVSANLPELSIAQKEYLEKYEKDQGERRPGFKFREKLENIGAGRLVAVAFVQDDATREILQASFAR